MAGGKSNLSVKIIIAAAIAAGILLGLLFLFPRPEEPAFALPLELKPPPEAAKVPAVGKVETEQIIDVRNKPAELTKISVEFRGDSVEPKEFKVKAGVPLIIYVASQDDKQHVFRFEDASLRQFAVGVQAGQIRTVSLTVPVKPGNYVYYDGAVPRDESPEGVMVVE